MDTTDWLKILNIAGVGIGISVFMFAFIPPSNWIVRITIVFVFIGSFSGITLALDQTRSSSESTTSVEIGATVLTPDGEHGMVIVLTNRFGGGQTASVLMTHDEEDPQTIVYEVSLLRPIPEAGLSQPKREN